MDFLISIFIILTIIGFLPFFRTILRLSRQIESDKKFQEMPIRSLLQELKQSAYDRLRTMPNTSLSDDIDFHEIRCGSFREILNIFQETPLREAVFYAREDDCQIAAVARFFRDSVDEIGIHKYLVLVMANGDIYEITANTTSQDEVVFLRNGIRIGQLMKKPSIARGFSKVFDYDVWDILMTDQYWGELRNPGKVVTWSSYRIFNQAFPEGVPVKISDEEDSFRTLRKCLLLAWLFFTSWTLWQYWFDKTSWSKSRWFTRANEDTVLLSNQYTLSPEQTEIYFLVSLFLRLLIFGRDYRGIGA